MRALRGRHHCCPYAEHRWLHKRCHEDQPAGSEQHTAPAELSTLAQMQPHHIESQQANKNAENRNRHVDLSAQQVKYPPSASHCLHVKKPREMESAAGGDSEAFVDVHSSTFAPSPSPFVFPFPICSKPPRSCFSFL